MYMYGCFLQNDYNKTCKRGDLAIESLIFLQYVPCHFDRTEGSIFSPVDCRHGRKLGTAVCLFVNDIRYSSHQLILPK